MRVEELRREHAAAIEDYEAEAQRFVARILEAIHDYDHGRLRQAHERAMRTYRALQAAGLNGRDPNPPIDGRTHAGFVLAQIWTSKLGVLSRQGAWGRLAARILDEQKASTKGAGRSR